MKIVVHTMEYHGGVIVSDLPVKNYSDAVYHEYKRIYNECFRDMRKALQIFPVDCCNSKEELQLKKEKIYVLEIDNRFIGSVAIWDMGRRYCNLQFLTCKVITFLQSFSGLQTGIREQSKCI